MSDCAKTVVGVDIGGANLKFALARDSAAITPQTYSTPFAIWRRPEELATALAAALKRFESVDALAVTMTGELADCFLDRAVGVRHIVRHTVRAAEMRQISDIAFYRLDGRFCDAHGAVAEPNRVAAANWHASASWVASEISADGLLVDIGSTTTDIIPLADGKVAIEAKTDFDRLRKGSLVYVGCDRTPVCALVDRLNFRGETVPVMNEFFATILDARTVMNIVAECVDDTNTADGQPRTKAMSANRLARMIGLDHRDVSTQEAIEIAEQVTHAASKKIDAALQKVWEPQLQPIIGGHGDDLISFPKGHDIKSLPEMIGRDLSRCLPAYAVARLRSQSSQVSDR